MLLNGTGVGQGSWQAVPGGTLRFGAAQRRRSNAVTAELAGLAVRVTQPWSKRGGGSHADWLDV